jgi:hypothetical protein
MRNDASYFLLGAKQVMHQSIYQDYSKVIHDYDSIDWLKMVVSEGGDARVNLSDVDLILRGQGVHYWSKRSLHHYNHRERGG